MSLEQAILHGKEKRRPYPGHRNPKNIDRSCRNHKSCKWCVGSRTYSTTKRRKIADEKVREFGERNG